MALDDMPGAAAPVEWYISHICEEFNCLPRAAIDELMNCPDKLVTTIINMRNYARAKEALDNAKRPEDKPTGRTAELVLEIQAEIIAEKRGDK